MKNAREAYLRNNVPRSERFIILNYRQGKVFAKTCLECIDFAGISGDEIESRFLEWANPEAAAKGLKPGEVEGGQGNGGKAYLRQMFEKGFFVSVSGGKLSVVSFIDPKKYVLDFVPDENTGKDTSGDSPVLPGVRKYVSEWITAYNFPNDHNITMVRGVAPTKAIDPDRLLEDIQQFPQARETIRTCTVHFYVNGSFRRELGVMEPTLHSAFPNPIKIPIPPTLSFGGSKITTARPPDFPQGELDLCIAANPLQGQALASWNRIDFHGKGISVIGWKRAEELPLKFPQYSRHLFGRLNAIWAGHGEVISFVYDAGGRLTEQWLPNGVNTRYTYNPDNTLQEVAHRTVAGRTLLSEHRYTYDSVGNRATYVDEDLACTTLTTATYTYDALNRLTTVQMQEATGGQVTTRTESYTYDALANRLTRTVDGTTEAYAYDLANQLTAIHQTDLQGPVIASLSYDLNGNLETKTTNEGTLTLTYNAWDQLIAAQKTWAYPESYVYDDQGWRIQKTVGASATDYLYDGLDIVGEYTTWGTPTAQYTHGPGLDAPLIRAVSGVPTYYHQDGLGSVVAMTDQTGQATGTARYDAWGALARQTGGIPQYGYTGREPDATGLIYYRARYYDPDTGRFTQRDPIGLEGGTNLYAYAGGDPVNYVDPLGTTPKSSRAIQVVTQVASYFSSTNIRNTLTTAADVAVDFSGIGGALKGAITVSTGQNPITGERFSGGLLDSALEVLPAAKRLKQVFNTFENVTKAVSKTADVPQVVFRGGGKNPANLTPRSQDNGMLSVRDSLSNPIPLKPGQQPPLPAGKPIQVIDTSKLPKGSVIRDGFPFGPQPPGHVSIGPNVAPQIIKDAIIETIRP